MDHLHLISQSIELLELKTNLARFGKAKEPLLFIGDAVNSLLIAEIQQYLSQSDYPCYALKADCQCRGVEQLINTFIIQISDQTMVELTVKSEQIISW